MKFGKSLGNQIEETLPEWKDKFLCYKELKRRLNLIAGGERPAKRLKVADDDAAGAAAVAVREEEDFMRLLEAELEKFNGFFVEKEEEYIIRQKDLQEHLTESISNNSKELMKVTKEIVDFHGEMVLLENYSALNYTGLVKIVKKYDKRTGALIRQPFIQKVLQQPFFTTDLLNKLVKECEVILDHLFAMNEPSISVEDHEHDNKDRDRDNGGEEKPQSSVRGIPELEEIEYMESLCMKSTVAALRALREIRSRSSTVSLFSLPPLQSSGWGRKVEEQQCSHVGASSQVITKACKNLVG